MKSTKVGGTGGEFLNTLTPQGEGKLGIQATLLATEKLKSFARQAYVRLTGKPVDDSNPVTEGCICGYALALTDLVNVPREILQHALDEQAKPTEDEA